MTNILIACVVAAIVGFVKMAFYSWSEKRKEVAYLNKSLHQPKKERKPLPDVVEKNKEIAKEVQQMATVLCYKGKFSHLEHYKNGDVVEQGGHTIVYCDGKWEELG